MRFYVRKVCVYSVVSAGVVVRQKLYMSIWNTDSLYKLRRMNSFIFILVVGSLVHVITSLRYSLPTNEMRPSVCALIAATI